MAPKWYTRRHGGFQESNQNIFRAVENVRPSKCNFAPSGVIESETEIEAYRLMTAFV